MLTLFDLNYRIYQNLCSYLDLIDIINLAEAFGITDRKIRQFEHEKNNLEIEFYQKFMQFGESLQRIFLQKNGSSLKINCMDCTDMVSYDIRLLFHFGGFISSIFVNYDGADDRMQMVIDDAIQSFCRKSLVSIELLNIDEDTLSTITRPFSNVEKLKFGGGFLTDRLSKFNKWFPKLRLLTLIGLEFEKSDCIEEHFGNLKELKLSNDEVSDFVSYSSAMTDTNVKIAIQLNPQLTVLSLSDDKAGHDDYGIRLNKQFLTFIKRKLPQLNTLNLHVTHLKRQTIHDHVAVKFNNLDSLAICIKTWSDLSNLFITSHRLKKLVLMSEDWHTPMNVNFKVFENFLKNNRSIEYLFIKDTHNDYDFYNENLIGLVNGLQHLMEISLVYNWMNVMATEAIVHFLSRCKRINKFTAFAYVNLNAASSYDQSTFIKSFRTHAEISGFDANAWNLEFSEAWKTAEECELLATFIKCDSK